MLWSILIIYRFSVLKTTTMSLHLLGCMWLQSTGHGLLSEQYKAHCDEIKRYVIPRYQSDYWELSERFFLMYKNFFKANEQAYEHEQLNMQGSYDNLQLIAYSPNLCTLSMVSTQVIKTQEGTAFMVTSYRKPHCPGEPLLKFHNIG